MKAQVKDVRRQNTEDLYTLLHDLAYQVLQPSFDHKSLESTVSDLTDAQIADLVDKTAHVKEWMGWS